MLATISDLSRKWQTIFNWPNILLWYAWSWQKSNTFWHFYRLFEVFPKLAGRYPHALAGGQLYAFWLQQSSVNAGAIASICPLDKLQDFARYFQRSATVFLMSYAISSASFLRIPKRSATDIASSIRIRLSVSSTFKEDLKIFHHFLARYAYDSLKPSSW